MLPIDPDAPWWVNAVITVIVLAGIPGLTLWVGGRKQRADTAATRVELGATRELAQKAADSSAVAEHEVRPNSGKSMADVLNRVAKSQEAQSRRLEALHETTGRLERGQADVAKDVGGIRSELRTERTERVNLSERVDQHLRDVPQVIEQAIAKGEANHVTNCPLRQTPKES